MPYDNHGDTDYENSQRPYRLRRHRHARFADPGGRSALHGSSKRNPRNLPCPTCGTKDVLTPADRAAGYQCDRCADQAEGIGGYGS